MSLYAIAKLEFHFTWVPTLNQVNAIMSLFFQLWLGVLILTLIHSR